MAKLHIGSRSAWRDAIKWLMGHYQYIAPHIVLVSPDAAAGSRRRTARHHKGIYRLSNQNGLITERQCTFGGNVDSIRRLPRQIARAAQQRNHYDYRTEMSGRVQSRGNETPSANNKNIISGLASAAAKRNFARDAFSNRKLTLLIQR